MDGAKKKWQPPSGGCVLKLHKWEMDYKELLAATFGWLCVETTASKSSAQVSGTQPPSGGCVLKLPNFDEALSEDTSSHLRVAVC